MPRITPADELAASFHPAEPDEVFTLATMKATTVRMPAGRHLWLQVLAARSGRSMNLMASELIRVGISEVLARMDVDVRREIEHDVAALAADQGIDGEEV